MDRTIPAAVQRAAREFGDATAIAEPGGPRLSYLDLHERTRTVARAIIAGGIQPGDRIAVWSPNTHHWVLAALGTLYAGATLVPVNTRFTGTEALDVLTRSRARGLIVAGPFLGADRLATLIAAASEQADSAAQISSWQLALPRLIVQVPVETASRPAQTPRPEAGPPSRPAQTPRPEPGPPSRPAQTPRPKPGRPSRPAQTARPQAGPPSRPPEARAAPGGTGQHQIDAGRLPPAQLAYIAAGRPVFDWAQFEGRAADVPGSAAENRAAGVGPDDISDILFTSGTTGRSKGAMSAHRQALDVARAWADCAELSQADRYLIVNPFFHSFGYKAGLLACLLTGATMVPQQVFDPAESMRLIESERITVFPGAPTIYASLLEHPDRASRDLSSLRLAVTGAAVVPVALVERMRDELSFGTVLTAYGLTEAVVVTMCRPGDDPETVAHTSGRATAAFEIKIAPPPYPTSPAHPASPTETASAAMDCAIEHDKPCWNAQSIRDLASTTGRASTANPAQIGEVLLRGPNVMLGYLDDPAATAEAIDAEGWLHTGDIGKLDARGYLTITDRLKDMYICGGFNVYPAEVEQVLARHPGVAESVVIGVPDARMGEVGRAYVLARAGQDPTADDLIAFCRTRLANYKVPRQVEFRTELPRNPAGKVLKRLLRQESP